MESVVKLSVCNQISIAMGNPKVDISLYASYTMFDNLVDIIVITTMSQEHTHHLIIGIYLGSPWIKYSRQSACTLGRQRSLLQ